MCGQVHNHDPLTNEEKLYLEFKNILRTVVAKESNLDIMRQHFDRIIQERKFRPMVDPPGPWRQDNIFWSMYEALEEYARTGKESKGGL